VIGGVESTVNLSNLGTLYFEKGELKNAIPYLLEAQNQYFVSKKIRKYFDVSYMLLRAYLEMGRTEEVQSIKESLQRVIVEENVEMTSRLYYTMGICASAEGQLDTALTFFNQSFNVALSENNKEDMCFALCGKAVWYKKAQEYEKALSIVENLKLRSLWDAFKVAKKSKSVQFINAYILMQLGLTHVEMNKIDLAENYFSLAEGLINPQEHVRAQKHLMNFKNKLEASKTQNPDITINVADNTVVEISKGKLELNNQFILLELLVEFVKKKGSFVTKSDLAEMLWNQDYDPSQHDNKIYVTIRRLRKLLEPNPKKPHYILRTKEGYQINPACIVKINA